MQTPTVRLICENDEAIKTFIPKDFWKISLLDEKHNLTFLSDEEFETENSAKEVLQKLDTQAVINSIESKIEEKLALIEPLLPVEVKIVTAGNVWMDIHNKEINKVKEYQKKAK